MASGDRPDSDADTADGAGEALDALAAIMGVLRDACPWDRVQTHASLRRHLLEESHEALDALDRIAALADSADGSPVDPDSSDGGFGGALDGAYVDLREELGDVLFQVVFHAHLAHEVGRFDLADVVRGVADKLIGRHPTIFSSEPAACPTRDRTDDPDRMGDAEPAGSGELNAAWERAKVAEKGRGSVMDGIAPTLPALAYAAKVLGKAEVVAPSTVDAHRRPSTAPADEATLGAALLALVSAARAADLDAEAALRAAARRLELAVRAEEESTG